MQDAAKKLASLVDPSTTQSDKDTAAIDAGLALKELVDRDDCNMYTIPSTVS